MAATPPVFNLFTGAWNFPNLPSSSLPDYSGFQVQLYVESRAGGLDIQYSDSTLYVPSIIVRFPKWDGILIPDDPDNIWVWQFDNDAVNAGRFYRTFFKETMHKGFPNEYRMHMVAQCDDFGIPIARGVVPYP